MKKYMKIGLGTMLLAVLAIGAFYAFYGMEGQAASSGKGRAYGEEAVSLQILDSGKAAVSLKKAGAGAGKKMVAIDAGHQQQGDSSTEPVGPGSSVKKAKVAGGATGVATGTPEYKLTLKVAKRLKKELEARGYAVYMIRSKNNVNISNKKRAQMANKSGSDIYIRLHADASSSSSAAGASALYPSTANPYVKALSKPSKKLSKCILNAYCKSTGIRNRGLVVRNDLTGTNWSKIPVTLIEMGFLSNASEDRKMQKASMQVKMAAGIADGIDAYFG